MALHAVDRPRAGRANGHHSSVRHHIRGLDTGGADWPVRSAHHGVLRDVGGTDGAGADPGTDTHSVLRRVGDGGLRAERAGLRLHRLANPPDSGEP